MGWESRVRVRVGRITRVCESWENKDEKVGMWTGSFMSKACGKERRAQSSWIWAASFHRCSRLSQAHGMHDCTNDDCTNVAPDNRMQNIPTEEVASHSLTIPKSQEGMPAAVPGQQETCTKRAEGREITYRHSSKVMYPSLLTSTCLKKPSSLLMGIATPALLYAASSSLLSSLPSPFVSADRNSSSRCPSVWSTNVRNSSMRSVTNVLGFFLSLFYSSLSSWAGPIQVEASVAREKETHLRMISCRRDWYPPPP